MRSYMFFMGVNPIGINVRFLLVFFFFFFSSAVWCAEPSKFKGFLSSEKNQLEHFSQKRVIVKLKNSSVVAESARKKMFSLAKKPAVVQQQLESPLFKKIKEIPRFNMAVYEVDPDNLDILAASEQVEAVFEDIRVLPLMRYSVPFVHADAVHRVGSVGEGASIAVLDSGVDVLHPAFQDKILAEACFSTADGVDTFSFCPNGASQQFGPGAAKDCFHLFDHGDCAHGTHVAGIAVGRGANGTGVAPGAKLVPIQVFHRDVLQNRIFAHASDLILALEWVLENKDNYNIAAVNMSIGGADMVDGYCDERPIKLVIDKLKDAGIVTVVASGNESASRTSYPGCVSSAITVAATHREQDRLAGFSNISAAVDLLAPGASIEAPIPGDKYAMKSGTSMAAPHVAGAFVLLRSKAVDGTVGTVERALKATGRAVTDFNSGLRYPRIDIMAAYQALAAGGEVSLQFENAKWRQSVVESMHSGYSGEGYLNTDNTVGSWAEFTLNVPTAKNYRFVLRYANGSSVQRSSDVLVNGEQQTTVNYSPTGAWSVWNEQEFTVYLNQGENTMRFVSSTPGGAANLDQLRFELPSSVNKKPEIIASVEDYIIFDDKPGFNINIEELFNDPDGDALSYDVTLSESDSGIVSFSNNQLRISTKNYGTVQVNVTASDGIHPSVAKLSFSVSVRKRQNTPPILSKPFLNKSYFEGKKRSLSLNTYFNDAEGQVLSYQAVSSAPNVASVVVSGTDKLSVRALSAGLSSITVVANDGFVTTSASFTVTVKANQAPYIIREIPDYVLEQGSEPFEIDLNSYFGDDDGDELSFEYEKDDDDNRNVTRKRCCHLSIDPAQLGDMEVTVTASDGKSEEVKLKFKLSVTASN